MSNFKNEVNIFVNKIWYMLILFVKLIGSIIIFLLIPMLTIVCIENGVSYFNLSIDNSLLRYAAVFLPGVVIGLIIKTKNLRESHSDDEAQNYVQPKWSNRDWKWVIGILVAMIILLVTLWLGNNQEVGGYFSFGANSVSITLGLVAIFYAFNQSEASSRQNSILENTLQDINTKMLQLSFIKDDLLKMDTNITSKYDELINITKKAENDSKIGEGDKEEQGSKQEFIKKLESFRNQIEIEKQKQKQIEKFNRQIEAEYLLDINNNILKVNSEKEMLYEYVVQYEVIFDVNDQFDSKEFLYNLNANLCKYTFKMYRYELEPQGNCGKNFLKIWLYSKGKNNLALIKNYIYSCSKGINKNINVNRLSSIRIKKSQL